MMPKCGSGLDRRIASVAFAASALSAALATAVCHACPPPDFNDSGNIDGADLGMLLAAWNTPEADLNGDLTTDGADLGILLAAWGDCPPGRPLECAKFATRLLEEEGIYYMVDVFAEPFPLVEVNAEAFGGSYTATQEPAVGTVFSGAGIIPVTVSVLGVNGLVQECTIALELQDITPPVVAIHGVKDGQEIVAPAAVSPWFEAHDAVTPDDQLLIEYTIDGKPAVPGEVIAAVGYHTVGVTATDAAGNSSDTLLTLLVRPRPVLDALVVLESLECSDAPGPDGYATIDAVVLVASHGAPVIDLDIASVAFWPLDSNGVPLNRDVMYVAGSTDPAGFYSYSTAEAMYQQGYWRIHFRAEMAQELVRDCPSGILITGRSTNGQPNTWDLDRFLLAVVDDNAVGTLARNGALNADPASSPPAQNECPPCVWKEKWDPTPDQCDVSETIQCDVGSNAIKIDAKADGATMSEGGYSLNNCLPATDYGDSCTALGSGTLLVWLEGRAACCQPSISVSLQPVVETKCTIQTTATATIGPSLDEKSDCGNAAAKASGTHTRNIEGSDTKIFMQSDIKSCNASMATVAVTSTLSVDVKAKKTHNISSAFAQAQIRRARGRITVTAVCSGCTNSPQISKQGF